MQPMKLIQRIKSQANVAGESLRVEKELQFCGIMQVAVRVNYGNMENYC
jgi:hypothetical protein